MTTDHRPNPIFEDAVLESSSEKTNGVLDAHCLGQEDVVPTQSTHIPLRYPLKHTLVTELGVDSESHAEVP
jgi:hypothetical protein